jgi:hypothetical protein
MIVGYSLLGGVGSALTIRPVYILITVACPDVKTRAKYVGRIPTWVHRFPAECTRLRAHKGTDERAAEIVSGDSHSAP